MCQPKEKIENKCISRGLKTGSGSSQPKEKRENKSISRAKNRGRVRPT